MRHHLDYRALALTIIRAAFFLVAGSVAGWRIKPAAAQHRKEAFGKRRRVHARGQSRVSKIVRGELAQNFCVFQTGRKFELAKLHSLKAASGIQLGPKSQATTRR